MATVRSLVSNALCALALVAVLPLMALAGAVFVFLWLAAPEA